MTSLNAYKKIFSLFVILCGLIVTHACGMDDPDAPDLVADFKSRSQPYQQSINQPDNTNRAFLVAYSDYETFLDGELNKAYKLLMSKLDEPQQVELLHAQQQWLKFRDKEFELINHNWTRDRFGSSANLSRGSYRASIIESRVVQLLQYAQNY